MACFPASSSSLRTQHFPRSRTHHHHPRQLRNPPRLLWTTLHKHRLSERPLMRRRRKEFHGLGLVLGEVRGVSEMPSKAAIPKLIASLCSRTPFPQREAGRCIRRAVALESEWGNSQVDSTSNRGRHIQSQQGCAVFGRSAVPGRLQVLDIKVVFFSTLDLDHAAPTCVESIKARTQPIVASALDASGSNLIS